MAEITITLKDLGPAQVHIDVKFDPIIDGIPDDKLTGAQKTTMLLLESLNMERGKLISDFTVIDTKHS